MKAINPATGQLIREYPEHSAAEVRQLLQRAEEAFGEWRHTPIAIARRLRDETPFATTPAAPLPP